jgi:hypothetical protein
MDAELGEQPATDEGTNNSNDQITDQTKAGPSHDLAGQPSRDDSNQQDDEKTFARHVHFLPS